MTTGKTDIIPSFVNLKNW